MSIHNRAAYQRINPNMSLKHDNTPKTACLSFKMRDGQVFFKAINTLAIKALASYFPDKTSSSLLIDLINGKSIYIPNDIGYTVSLVYK